MAATDLQHRKTLLFEPDEERNAVDDVVPRKQPVTFVTESTSIDDMDMLSLNTRFDKQMILGRPMYHDILNREVRTADYFKLDTASHLDAPTLTDRLDYGLASSINRGKSRNNPMDKILRIRKKYLKSSLQDAESNLKNHNGMALIYPEPLPKFWKFFNDSRLKPEIKAKKEDQYEQNGFDEEDVDAIAEEYSLENRRGFDIEKVKYTGQFFSLESFKKAFTENRNTNQEFSNIEKAKLPEFDEFLSDFEEIMEMNENHSLNVLSAKRLEFLNNKFDLFQHLKSKSEIAENKVVPYRDFYNSRKVDCNFLLSGCVTQRQLSEFIWNKLNIEPERPVYHVHNTDQDITLKEIYEIGCEPGEKISLGFKLIDDEFLEWYRDVYLLTYHLAPSDRMAEGSLKGKELRFYILAKTFLEFDNLVGGQYLAELLILFVINPIEISKYQLIQLSVDFQFYLKEDKDNWWVKFSEWIQRWKLVSYNVRWNVQINRCYTKLFKCDRVVSFEDFLSRIFDPLLSTGIITENWPLKHFLFNICSIDLLVSHTDDFIWKRFNDIKTSPSNWTACGDNPPIAYYMYYIYQRLSELNYLLRSNGHPTITLGSTCSPFENRTSQFGTAHTFTDQDESLVSNILLTNGRLLNGESLWKGSELLIYVYYLFQIPVIVSPLSSVSRERDRPTKKPHHMFVGDVDKGEIILEQSSRDISQASAKCYEDNPFMRMFQMGIRVSLSSHSILFNESYTIEPLIEEYSVAASIYLLNAADLCELSRNGVLSSGYEGYYKAHWSGSTIAKTQYLSDAIGGVDTWYDNEGYTTFKHNVPAIRRQYRIENLEQEWEFASLDLAQ